jgi:hypothetical protein
MAEFGMGEALSQGLDRFLIHPGALVRPGYFSLREEMTIVPTYHFGCRLLTDVRRAALSLPV